MFEKLENFMTGIADGVQKGINEMAEEARKEQKTNKTVNISVEDYMKLHKRVNSLEAEMKVVKELIATLQQQAMGGVFEDDDPLEEDNLEQD